MTDGYDFVIVGGGSAGCVVAARLSEDPSARVLLLEAGGDDAHPDVQNPVKWPKLLTGDLDWGYATQPQTHCRQRVDPVPRAKMLGGCHSHNASAWVRGHQNDFDRWASLGCAGWGWDEVLPIFKRIEDWRGPASELRGVGGPMYVAPPVDPNPIAAAFVEAGAAVGLPKIEDNNAGIMEGTSFFNLTIKDGKRHSVVAAYLRPAMRRPNLTVVTHAEARRLILNGSRCTGVEYVRHGSQSDGIQSVHAEREVVLCAGAIGSPKTLLLSGIGPEPELKRHGIPVAANLPGVGRNLQDHVLVGGINYECHERPPKYRNNGVESTLWWRSRPGLTEPDIQPVLVEFPFATPELANRLPGRNCYAIAPSVVRIESRGTVTLASSDPADAPVIDPNFLSRDGEMNSLLAAMQLCREMGASDAFAPFRKREVMPGQLSRSQMVEFIRMGATTYFHPTGTCKMGVDAEAAVDPQLRVAGIEGLRVADASIMPTITCGNTNAPTIMIAEKAAELIRG